MIDEDRALLDWARKRQKHNIEAREKPMSTNDDAANPYTPPRRDYSKQLPSPGRIVTYHLTDTETVPMIIVKVFNATEVSGQAFVDDDKGLLHVKSAHQGTKPGEWDWPPRI